MLTTTQGRLALRAHRWTMLHHDVHRLRRYEMQRLAWVAKLPARLLTTPPAQAAGPQRLVLQTIARGRLVAVVTILGQLGQPRLQFPHPFEQQRVLRSRQFASVRVAGAAGRSRLSGRQFLPRASCHSAPPAWQLRLNCSQALLGARLDVLARWLASCGIATLPACREGRECA